MQTPPLTKVSPGQLSTHEDPQAYFEFKQLKQEPALLQSLQFASRFEHAIFDLENKTNTQKILQRQDPAS